MRIEYDLTRADVVQTSAQMMTRVKWWILAMFSLVALTNIWPLISLVRASDWSGAVARFVPIALLAIIFVLLTWVSPLVAARRYVLRSVSWDIADDGVHIVTNVSTGDVKWEAFVKYRETRKLFMLYIQKSQAQFIPKRALSAAEVVQLRQLLDAHVKRA